MQHAAGPPTSPIPDEIQEGDAVLLLGVGSPSTSSGATLAGPTSAATAVLAADGHRCSASGQASPERAVGWVFLLLIIQGGVVLIDELSS